MSNKQDTREIGVKSIVETLEKKARSLAAELEDCQAELRQRVLEQKKAERQLGLSQNRVAQLEEDRDKLVSQLAEMEVAVEAGDAPSAASDAVPLPGQLARLEAQCNSLREAREVESQENQRLSELVTDLRENLKELRGAAHEASTAQQELDALRTFAESSRDEIAALQRSFDVEKERADNAETELATANESLAKVEAEPMVRAEDLHEAGERIVELQTQLDKALETAELVAGMEEDLASAIEKNEALTAERDEVRAELRSFHEALGDEGSIDSLQSKLAAANRRIGVLEEVEEESQTLRSELESLKARLSETEELVVEASDQYSASARELENVRAELEELKSAEPAPAALRRFASRACRERGGC